MIVNRLTHLFVICCFITLASVACDSGSTDPKIPSGDPVITGVSVAATPNPVEMPGTVQATASVSPSNAPQGVTWTSSDPNLATVNSSGVVMPLRRGTVAITATSTADATKSGSVQIGILCPDPRRVASNVDGDTTWENWLPDPGCFDYVVQADLLINDETLTLEPGTVVGFEQGLGLRVRGSARLSAAGTSADPIVFTGDSPTRGFWNGVSLEFTGDTEHVITHTTIEFTGGAGISNTQDASLIVEGGVTLRLENSTLRQSAGYGLFLARESQVLGSGGNVMTENALGPAYAFGSEVAHLTQGGGSLLGNDSEAVVVYPTAIDDAAVWATGVYRILRVGPVEFQVKGSLTLGPGVELRFEADQFMSVNAGAGLSANGTADRPVVFTGTEAVPGHWDGLVFVDTDNAMNRLEHAIIEYAGGAVHGGVAEAANLVLTWGLTPPRIAVSNTTIRGGAGYGVYARFGTQLTAFDSNILTENQLGPASIDANVVAGLMPSSSYAGNTVDEVTINGAPNSILDADATWHDLGVPYHLKRANSEEPRVVNGATLTLMPGVEMLVGAAVGLAFWEESSLVAVGTPEAPIVLRGRNGPWKGLDFFDATGTLDYISVSDAGSSAYGLIEQAGVLSLRTNGDVAPESRVVLGNNVTLSGPAFDLAFGYNDAFAEGCRDRGFTIHVNFLDAVDAHCLP